MRIRRASLASALALAGILMVSTADAQMVTEKTTTYRGTITEVNPSSSTIIMRSEPSAPATTYTYNKETVFVDDAGKIVTYEALKDSPATITYTRDGDRMIVTKVLKEPGTVRKETTTTTTTN
jgi:hypothetical protein